MFKKFLTSIFNLKLTEFGSKFKMWSCVLFYFIMDENFKFVVPIKKILDKLPIFPILQMSNICRFSLHVLV